MLHLRDYPIAKQLTWLNLLVTTVALLLSGSAFLVYDVISARNARVRNVSMQAQIIGSNTVSASVFDYPESAEDTLSALRASRNILYAGIYTPDGRPLAEYWRDGKGQTPRLPSTTMPQTESHFFAGDEVAVLHPIVQEGKPIGAVYIRSDSQSLENRLKRYAQTIIAVLLLSLAAATFFAWRSRRAVSGPLVRLAKTARVVSREKNYSAGCILLMWTTIALRIRGAGADSSQWDRHLLMGASYRVGTHHSSRNRQDTIPANP